MVRILTVGIDGPLEFHADGYSAALLAAGFTLLSAKNQLRLFAHLSRWLVRKRLGPGDLTEVRIVAFLRARRRARYTCWRSQRGLVPLLAYLREAGLAPQPLSQPPRTPIDRLLALYEKYLSDERGLAELTRRRLVDLARRFFKETGATHCVLKVMASSDVRAFLRGLSRDYAPTSLAGMSSDLRSLLRFLFVAGIIRRSLADAVPSAVGWRDRTLPQGIPGRDVSRLLRSCDRRSVSGRRDFAILLLLVRLGLRAGEVVRLCLDDIDWRSATIVIHGKGAKRDQLPLPADVGEALAAYLQWRPRVDTRSVFIRVRAPHRALNKVGQAVFQASRRAGLKPVWPHRLRRTAATEMLRRGASLAQIAEVLRHTSTQTTAIYAKVDRRALRDLARPWPRVRP